MLFIGIAFFLFAAKIVGNACACLIIVAFVPSSFYSSRPSELVSLQILQLVMTVISLAEGNIVDRRIGPSTIPKNPVSRSCGYICGNYVDEELIAGQFKFACNRTIRSVLFSDDCHSS